MQPLTMQPINHQPPAITSSMDLAQVDPQWAWEPWQASEQEPWNESRLRLLLRRGGFGGEPKSIAALKNLPYTAAIEALIGSDAKREQERFEEDSAQLLAAVRAGGNIQRLAAWWVHRMIHSPSPLIEKMTLFWHGHFATGADKVIDTELMAQQNQVLRKHAIGDYRQLVHEVAKDPAMLLYLDSASNRKAHPNENFARELMELFCLGEGNYSEKDVQELARCFTGWEIRRKSFRFNSYQHDSGAKTLFGIEGIESGEAAIDQVLAHRAMPMFMAKKLFRFFLCDEPEPSQELLAPLAQKWVESDHQVEPVVRMILSSRLMLSGWSIGKKIRSPVELAIEWVRALDISTNLDRLSKGLGAVGQSLFHPPNVKGWDAGRAWINSSTLIGRANLLVDLLQDANTRFAGGELNAWVKSQQINTAESLATMLEDSLLAISLSDSERSQWLEQSTQGNRFKEMLLWLSQNPKLHLT
ncbi:MAG: hypothetical protein RL240_2453 [Planctomycetota bacterium]|jgi:uncharacterized protein (DUF1800 family)